MCTFATVSLKANCAFFDGVGLHDLRGMVLYGDTKCPGGCNCDVGSCGVGSLRGNVGVSTQDVGEDCGPSWPLLQATFLAEV